MTQKLLVFPSIGDYLVIKESVIPTVDTMGEVKAINISTGTRCRAGIFLSPGEVYRIKNIFINRQIRDALGCTAIVSLRLPNVSLLQEKVGSGIKITSRTVYFSSKELENKCYIFKSIEEANNFISVEFMDSAPDLIKRFALLDD